MPVKIRGMEPVFIVAAPRSGGALLIETLGRSEDAITVPGGMEAAIVAQCDGRDRLTAADATPEVATALRGHLSNIAGKSRLLDASPRNILRVPFLHAVFPEATFVYIYREPRRAVYDMSNGADVPVEELARRWKAVTSLLLDDLEQLPPGAWLVAAYSRLLDEPKTVIARVAEFLGIKWDGTLPPQPMPSEPPQPEVVAELDAVDDITRDVAARARNFFATPPPRSAPAREKAIEMTSEPDTTPFRSVSTQSFPALLQQLGITLVVSTYQSGRLIFIRAENATTLNTHFRMFRSPMGIAVGDGRLAIGTEREVWDYRNQPAVSAHLDPPAKHDACYVPRKIHVTGDIRIHEIGYASSAGDVKKMTGDAEKMELWMVNTRFSTLCTLDDDSSFVPRWRPAFVTHLAAEDRCHLNGMAIIDGRIRYVTAFGATNTPGGWRENKASGGLLLDVDSGEIVLRGLSMPHSPRQYDGRFFILESGKGTMATADLSTGRVEMIAELPGFTRGLAFAGPLAFVGLSQVRESNVFGGIPLTERVSERQCAIYVVDLRNGQTIAFLRFEGDVQEIFDVQVLHGIRYPELLELTSPLVSTSFTVPDEALAELPIGVVAVIPRGRGGGWARNPRRRSGSRASAGDSSPTRRPALF